MTRERYAVLVLEREAPLRGGQGVQVRPMDVEPSMLSNVETAAAEALNGVIGASGEYRLVFSSARPA